jgi:hypothetical protein
MEEKETTKIQHSQHHTVRLLPTWLISIASVIIIGVVSYAVYLVRQYIAIVGWIWLISLGLMPTFGVIFATTWLLKYILRFEIKEIGPAGQLLIRCNQIREIHPLGLKEHRVRIKEEKEKFAVPLLIEILKSGLLGLEDLLLGYHLEGDPRWGSWDDLRTFVVAGKSRSGKTVTMVFFILQALLSGSIVYVCDPHHNKPSGLLKVLEPIINHLRIAKSYEDIVTATVEFKSHMTARKDGKETELTPIVIVYDEWSELLRELDQESTDMVVNTVLSCAEAYAGFGGYAMVGGHEWTAHESGGKKGGAVRRGFHAAFVHRQDDEYAKFLLKGAAGKKAAVKAPNLPKGQAYFQDSEGELDYLLIPYYGKEKEAIIEVARMLEPETPPELPAFEQRLLPYAASTEPIVKIELENNAQNGTHEEIGSTPLLPSSQLPHFQETREVKTGNLTDEQYSAALRELNKKLREGQTPSEIRKSLGITGGRAFQDTMAALNWMQEQLEEENHAGNNHH